MVPLLASLIGEWAVGGELEIVVQVVEQGGIVLELDVDVGEHEVNSGIVGFEPNRGEGACFGFGGAVQRDQRTS